MNTDAMPWPAALELHRGGSLDLFGIIRVCQETRLFEALLTCQIKLEI